MPHLTFAFTGHRPKDLGDFTQEDLYASLNEFLPRDDHRTGEPYDYSFITGGALGIDTWAAEYALDHDLPLRLILPFNPTIMAALWTPQDRERLNAHAAMADACDILSNDYHPSFYQLRNIAMVDAANGVLAFWNGKKNGGTYNCIRYALSTNTPVIQAMNKPPLRNPSRITTI